MPMKQQILYYQQKLDFEIDAADLFDALNGTEKIVVLDCRTVEAYEQEHIPNAINFPHKTITAKSTAHLDKALLYVTYCDGIGCNASTKGALNLASLNFNVKELSGGLDWWKRDGYKTSGTKAVQGFNTSCGC
ncbi:MAG: rhodanese-like domain-containing protein [Bacteroidales bacterium]|nr:rhodanese-like domain-containing protein [Bacteroidales bacterium]